MRFKFQFISRNSTQQNSTIVYKHTNSEILIAPAKFIAMQTTRKLKHQRNNSTDQESQKGGEKKTVGFEEKINSSTFSKNVVVNKFGKE